MQDKAIYGRAIWYVRSQYFGSWVPFGQGCLSSASARIQATFPRPNTQPDEGPLKSAVVGCRKLMNVLLQNTGPHRVAILESRVG